jgi:SAM-dependent methyltransferase
MDGLVYAYHVPHSSQQQQYIQARLAVLAEERRRKGSVQHDDPLTIERSVSHESSRSTGSGPTKITSPADLLKPHRRRESDYGVMEPSTAAARSSTTSSTSSSAHSDRAHHNLLKQPFELRHGRRYVREIPYPLPCDLAEIQRQNLRTMIGCKVFGRALCSPNVQESVPAKVLDVGCGSGYWAAMCNDYFLSLGVENVEFIGLDVAPLAPDLNKHGVNWKFVQHDFRRLPLPFDDGEFDLIMLKDLSLAVPIGTPSEKFVDEIIRILREGGTLEIWESDHVIRSLVPHPPPAASKKNFHDAGSAEETATFPIALGTPFAPARNKYILHANKWISEALERRKLPPAPCARIAQVLYQEPDTLGDVGFRRVAIPFSELRWERENFDHSHSAGEAVDSPLSSKGKSKLNDRVLTEEQAELRQTALLTALQKVESLEPLLKEVSGKNSEEWSHWWASMMADLLDPSKAALSGECLELGAWWATKLAEK